MMSVHRLALLLPVLFASVLFLLAVPGCGGGDSGDGGDGNDSANETAGDNGGDTGNGAAASLAKAQIAATLQNMKRLCDAVTMGIAERKALPSSTGKRFWIALIVGDGPEGRYRVRSSEEGYVSVADVDMLRAPTDSGLMSVEAAMELLQQIKEDGDGAAALTDEQVESLCSFNGPVSPMRAFSPSRNDLAIACDHTIVVPADGEYLLLATKNGARSQSVAELSEDDRFGLTFEDGHYRGEQMTEMIEGSIASSASN